MRWMEQPVFFVDFEGSLRLGRPRVRHRHAPGGQGDRDPDPAVRADGARARPRTRRSTGCGRSRWPAARPSPRTGRCSPSLRERGPLAAHYAGRRELAPKVGLALPAQLAGLRQARRAASADWGPWIDSAQDLRPAVPRPRVGPARVARGGVRPPGRARRPRDRSIARAGRGAVPRRALRRPGRRPPPRVAVAPSAARVPHGDAASGAEHARPGQARLDRAAGAVLRRAGSPGSAASGRPARRTNIGLVVRYRGPRRRGSMHSRKSHSRPDAPHPARGLPHASREEVERRADSDQ